MLAVEGFVNTFSPAALSSSTITFVVVLFPAVPETAIKPCGADEIALESNLGWILNAIVPGRADPPPLRTSRRRYRAILPSSIAAKVRN